MTCRREKDVYLPYTMVKLDLRSNYFIDRSVKYIIRALKAANANESRKHYLDIDIDNNKLITGTGWFELGQVKANETHGSGF